MSDDIVKRLRKVRYSSCRHQVGDECVSCEITVPIVDWIGDPNRPGTSSIRSRNHATGLVILSAVTLHIDAADEIERLRAELRQYTGDGHNTLGEPCTQSTQS